MTPAVKASSSTSSSRMEPSSISTVDALEVVLAAGGEVVDDDHLVHRGFGKEVAAQVRADEAGAAGHDDAHQRRSTFG